MQTAAESDPPVMKNAGKLTCVGDCGPFPVWVHPWFELGVVTAAVCGVAWAIRAVRMGR